MCCIITWSHLVLLLPRNKVAEVMYYGSTDIAASGIASPEMSAQEIDFLEMADEFKNPAQGGSSTMQLFLKYSPDSVTRLFDRCLWKPCMGQVMNVRLRLGVVGGREPALC